MRLITDSINVQTQGENDLINITEETMQALFKSKFQKGLVNLFVSGSTAALTTIEYEPGLIVDFPKMLERLAPKNFDYGHEQMWHDGNGHSHVKASLIGPSLSIPFSDGKLLLGTWQQIVLIELDTKKRERNLVLQIIGE